MIYVVGSGPSGVAVSYALLKRGASVTMLDAGFNLEPEHSAVADRLGGTSPDAWSPGDVGFMKGATVVDTQGLPRKLSYGSDFPYRSLDGGMPLRQRGVEVVASHARGGLSNVWGAAVLPYRNQDMEGWPITAQDLAPCYREVFELMPLAAVRDDLERDFPLHASRYVPLRQSRQAKEFSQDLDRHRVQLQAAGITYGESRLAVRADLSPEQGGCNYCGMCLYGCPRRLIYNSAFSLERLGRFPGFSYRAGIFADRLTETAGEVAIACRSIHGGEALTLRAPRVYLASGVMGTARLLLASFGGPAQGLKIKTSQYFLLPLLRRKPVRGARKEALHTLAQTFLEIAEPFPGGKPVHIQAYTHNDLYERELNKRFGFLGGLAGRLAGPLFDRLIVLQGYLHSDDSSAISVRVEGHPGRGELVLKADNNPRAMANVRAVRRKLVECRHYVGAYPISPMLQIGKPGHGNHIGGTFPMRHSPSAFETDVNGRLAGTRGIHVVDASVFPAIPGPTITLNVMANAYRIGSAAVA
jgi:choline dehydrogenase-like flavoprotein